VSADEGFFYAPEEASREVLEALRLYRAADAAMRRRTRTSMAMGENELLAVRFLLRAQRTTPASPTQLAQYLGISTSSTTVLIDRLEQSGHVRREAHPTDRRSIVLIATGRSEDEVRATLGDMHERMRGAAVMPPDEATAVVAFLSRIREAIDTVAAPQTTVPPVDHESRIA
jgi:DNA-binding MarR family transcriptional regulator